MVQKDRGYHRIPQDETASWFSPRSHSIKSPSSYSLPNALLTNENSVMASKLTNSSHLYESSTDRSYYEYSERPRRESPRPQIDHDQLFPQLKEDLCFYEDNSCGAKESFHREAMQRRGNHDRVPTMISLSTDGSSCTSNDFDSISSPIHEMNCGGTHNSIPNREKPLQVNCAISPQSFSEEDDDISFDYSEDSTYFSFDNGADVKKNPMNQIFTQMLRCEM